eukprot:11219672-Lingulodinium_polyedra.AAC.1
MPRNSNNTSFNSNGNSGYAVLCNAVPIPTTIHAMLGLKRCTAMRSNRPSAAAPARKSHACALHARAPLFWRARGV